MSTTSRVCARSVRFPVEVLAKLKALAELNGRTVNGEILYAIKHYLEEQAKKEAAN